MQIVKNLYQQHLRIGLKSIVGTYRAVVGDVELSKVKYLHDTTSTSATTTDNTTIITTSTTNIATKACGIKMKILRNVETEKDVPVMAQELFMEKIKTNTCFALC